jgi:hypothetical protein
MEEMDCRQGYEMCEIHRFRGTPPIIFRHTFRTLEKAKHWMGNGDGNPKWIERSHQKATI